MAIEKKFHTIETKKRYYVMNQLHDVRDGDMIWDKDDEEEEEELGESCNNSTTNNKS